MSEVASIERRAHERLRDGGPLLVRFGELEPQAPQWLVRGLIERDAFALAFGDPGSGKSFLGIDVAASVATGLDWHGHRAEKLPVVYIAGEGHSGLARRRRAWEIARGTSLADEPLYVSTAPVPLGDPEHTSALLGAVDSVPVEPGLVVVDTLARNFGAGDENSTADMSLFIAAVDQVRTRYGCTVLVVHHSGHGDKQRARGAMALKGALDAEYRMEKGSDGLVRLEATKMKDAEPPPPMAFQLRTVELGFTDEDGDEVTSAVLHRTEWTPPPAQGKGTRAGRGRHQQTALDVLQGLMDKHQGNRDALDGRPDCARVSLKDWRKAMQDAGIPRQRTYDIPKTLEDSGRVVIENGFAWPADE